MCLRTGNPQGLLSLHSKLPLTRESEHRKRKKKKVTDGIRCAYVQETPRGCPPSTANCHQPGNLNTGKGKRRRDGTRGLPRRSPFLVLLSPKHVSHRSSNEIWCTSAGMIAPATRSAVNPQELLPAPSACSRFPSWSQRQPESSFCSSTIPGTVEFRAWNLGEGCKTRTSQIQVLFI